MNAEVNMENIGEQLGSEGVSGIVSNAEAYCACEERRIALVNEPRIVALQAEGQALLKEEQEVVERLRHEPPPGDLRSRQRRAAYHWIVTLVFVVAGFVFSVYALEPFRFGLKTYLYSIGIAIVVPFLADFTIVRLKSEILVKCVAIGGVCAALLSLVLLAAIRGELMAESLKDQAPVITFDDADPQSPQSQNTFYDKTIPLLQLTMILLAISMELAAGLAMYEAWRLCSDAKEDWGKLRTRMKEIEERKSSLVFEIVALTNAPKVFNANFWKNFYRAMLTNTVRSMITKGLVAVLSIILIGHKSALAQSHTTIVIAVDLSRSVGVRSPDGKTEFQKNIEAVTKQLARVPLDSRITIIGITDHSFTQPLILLSATIPVDAGYFGERLSAARGELLRAWKARAAKLTPCYLHTDIIGSFALADQLFNHSPVPDRKLFLIYSDMRQSTKELDLEKANIRDSEGIATTHEKAMPDLRGIQVAIAGIDGAGKSISYWQSLRAFWADYLRASGADLTDYSALRDATEIR